MHLLALTAGAALASIAPATAPPGDPRRHGPCRHLHTRDLAGRDPFTVTLTVPEGWRYEPEFNVLWAFDDTAYIIPGMFTEAPVSWLEPTNQVPVDNCAWRDSDATTVATAAELAAAMAEQRGSLVSAPEPLQIGSVSGVVFTAAPVAGPTATASGLERRRPDGLHGQTTRTAWWYHGDGIHDVKTFLALDLAVRARRHRGRVPTRRCCRRINASCSP